MIKSMPYEEMYFLKDARKIRGSIKQAKLAYLGGVSNTTSMEKVMNEGFDFIQLGRALIKDPNIVNNL